MTFKLIDHNRDHEREFNSRAIAEEKKEEMVGLGAKPEDLEIRPVKEPDGGQHEPVTMSEDGKTEKTISTHPQKPNNTPDNETSIVPGDEMMDPLKTLPGWMITEVSYSDRGDTNTTVNKRGCHVIANYLGIEVNTEAITRASESDFEYAEFEAVAYKTDGGSFTGHGTARADGHDQPEDAGWKLDMQAETRAYKRAVKSATGGGIEAFQKEHA